MIIGARLTPILSISHFVWGAFVGGIVSARGPYYPLCTAAPSHTHTRGLRIPARRKSSFMFHYSSAGITCVLGLQERSTPRVFHSRERVDVGLPRPGPRRWALRYHQADGVGRRPDVLRQPRGSGRDGDYTQRARSGERIPSNRNNGFCKTKLRLRAHGTIAPFKDSADGGYAGVAEATAAQLASVPRLPFCRHGGRRAHARVIQELTTAVASG